METTELKGKLPRDYARRGISTETMTSLINLIANLDFTGSRGKARDMIGRVYEYFLGKFAAAEGKLGGEFFTPRSVVRVLVEMLEPYDGRVYTNDKKEFRKKITTLAVEGERLVLLDNLAGAVGNDVLDMALTTDTWKDRLLGGNRVYNGPLNVTWFATGNNVQLAADTSRRVCHIRLESEKERPETRADVKYEDLRAHVLRNRGKLLAAALTILRGWIVAGKPRHGLKPWGSFEQWSNVVREALSSPA